MLGGLKTVFRGLCFTPILPESSFDLESHLVLGALLATASVARSSKSNLVLAQSVCSNRYLQTCRSNL